MTTVAQPVNGQDIAVAARASRQVLDVLLAEQGTSFAPFATMNTVVALGRSLDCDALVRHLGAAFDVDATTVRSLLHGLEALGLVQQTAESGPELHYQLTREGQAEQQRLSKLAAGVAAELYRGFNAEELATTRRVLVALTERAAAQVRSALTRPTTPAMLM
jgi:DNA-binding MarR family transcriptional regulator